MGEKIDRRIRKTKAQLRAGLTKLMKQKSVKEITVKELVDEVDINRSTFYLHYTDINQMLDTLEEDLLNQIMDIIHTHPLNPLQETNFYFIQDIFTILAENADLCSALLGPNGDIAFVHQIEQIISDQYMKMFQSSSISNRMNLPYYYSFCLTGCVGIIKTWLKDGAKESPEEMAKLTFNLIQNAMQDLQKH